MLIMRMFDNNSLFFEQVAGWPWVLGFLLRCGRGREESGGWRWTIDLLIPPRLRVSVSSAPFAC
jgi:hypothetical protein